jgi:hypothetical protein
MRPFSSKLGCGLFSGGISNALRRSTAFCQIEAAADLLRS